MYVDIPIPGKYIFSTSLRNNKKIILPFRPNSFLKWSGEQFIFFVFGQSFLAIYK